MNHLIDRPARGIIPCSGSGVEASKVTRIQSPRVEVVALYDTGAREKVVITRLMLAALSGTISAIAAIFTTVIDWTVLGWRTFWLVVCVSAFVALITFIWMACARFYQLEVIHN